MTNKPEWENKKFVKQEFLLKEIDIINNQISKYDEYSLIVKGWAITLWTALFFFAINQIQNELKMNVLLLSIGSLLAFWLIDAYFKYFQRVSIARSTFISDYLNEKINFNQNITSTENNPPNESPQSKENNEEFFFPIYDPVGRISKKRKKIGKKKILRIFEKTEYQKKENNYYWKNYIKKCKFLRAFTVRVVSSLYLILIGSTLCIIWSFSKDPICLLIPIFTVISFSLFIIFFILSHFEKL